MTEAVYHAVMVRDAGRAAIRGPVARAAVVVLLFAAVSGAAQTTQDGGAEPEEPPSPTLIQLVDPLDEPEFYCVTCRGSERASIWKAR